MKKKFASLFLVMALVLTMIPASAFATDGDAITYLNSTANRVVDDGSENGFTNDWGVTLYSNKAEYAPNEDIYIKVEGAEAAGDGSWIGIYDTPAANTTTKSLVWSYTDMDNKTVIDVEDFIIYGPNATCFDKGSDYAECRTELTAGNTYYIVVFNNGRWAVLPITIVDDSEEPEDPNLPTEESLTVTGDTFDREQDEIIVTTNYATTDKDWVGIYPKGYSPAKGPSLGWYYVKDKPTTVDVMNKVNVTDPHSLGYSIEDGKLRPGQYTIYLFENNGYDVIESADVTVTGEDVTVPEGYSMTLVPDETLTTPNANIGSQYLHLVDEGFGNGLNIKVTAPAGADTTTMWVGIYDEGFPSITSFAYTDVGEMAGTTEENAVLFDVSEAWKDDAKIGGKRKLVLYTDADSYIAVETIYFFVRPYLGEQKITFDNSNLVYTGAHQVPSIADNQIAGKDSRHWTATFPEESIEVGEYTVNAKFHGEIGGSATGAYKIVAKDVANADVTVAGVADATATGSAIKPVPTVTYNGMTLVAGTDYDVTYGENTAPGKGTVTITGKGNYTGTKTVEFNIVEKVCNHVWDTGKMTKADTCTEVGVKTYTCTLDASHTKTENVDVIKDHAWNDGEMTKADTCTEAGVKTYTCTLDATHTKTEDVDAIKDHAWDGGTVTKAATCKAEGEKTFVCKNDASHKKTENVAVDSNAHAWGAEVVKPATCTTNGTKTTTCNTCGAQKAAVGDQKTGHKYEVVAGKDATCTETGLTAGEKCSVCGIESVKQTEIAATGHKYEKITTPATMKAAGKIVEKCACGDIAKTTSVAKIKSVTVKAAVYTGKALKPAVTVKDAKGKKLVKGTDYTVTYKNNKKVGKATATVKFIGKYKGTKAVTFKVNPKAAKLKKPVAAKKAMTVKWTKVAKEATGYEVMYSTSKKFKSGNKTVTIKKAKTTSTKIKKLKSKKTYYVKIRTYKTVGKVKYYSAWSIAQKCKVK